MPQLTITSRFDNFAAARKLDPELRNWQLSERFDARKQFIAFVRMDQNLYYKLSPLVRNENTRLLFMLSSYNGGLGGLLQDRKLCASVPSCDPNSWFDHVELYSYKSRTKLKGYGHSFYQINREYVRTIWFDKRKLFYSID